MPAPKCLLPGCHGEVQAGPPGAGLLGSQPRASRQPAHHGNLGSGGRAMFALPQEDGERESSSSRREPLVSGSPIIKEEALTQVSPPPPLLLSSPQRYVFRDIPFI